MFKYQNLENCDYREHKQPQPNEDIAKHITCQLMATGEIKRESAIDIFSFLFI